MLQPPNIADASPYERPLDPIAPLRAALSGHYEIEREIGQGAFATVYLARDLKHERKVAIKVLNADPTSDTGELRFVREIRMLARLQHPNILPLHDSGHVEALLYYVMPYVNGETVRERIDRERQMKIEDAVCIAQEAADAFAYAHAQGIIHRDIKPENILISGGHAIVADFGIARAIDMAGIRQLTKTGTSSPGTPAYMAPEQLLGESIDARSDIYSLGCVLYEMVTGKAPFTGKEGFVKRFTEPPIPPSKTRRGIPEWLDETLATALAREPVDRYSDAGQLAKALTLGLAQERATPRHPSARAHPQLEPPSLSVTTASRPPRAMAASASGHLVAQGVASPRSRFSDRQIGVSLGAAGILAATAIAWIAVPSIRPASLRTAELNNTRFAVFAAPGKLQPARDSVASGLYSALTQWDGMTVVPSDEISAAVSRRPMSRGLARDVAERLGAGRFVWQDPGADGDRVSRIELVETNSGRAIRSVALNPTETESGNFHSVVTQLLSVPGRPASALNGEAETLSYPALIAYDSAHGYLAAWKLREAESALRVAVAADPAFGAGHAWLAQVIRWTRPESDIEWRDQASQALLKAERLESRDLLLATGLAALAAEDYTGACHAYRRIIERDSTDFLGWLGLGECQGQDDLVIEPKNGEEAHFRSSYYSAARSFTRALSIEPGAHVAVPFAKLQRLLPTAPTQIRIGRTADKKLFAAYPVLEKDTLAFIPYPSARFERLAPSSVTRQAALDEDADALLAFATDWTRRDPGSALAFEALAEILDTKGQISAPQPGGMSARDAVRRALQLATTEHERLLLRTHSVWLTLKDGNFSGARAQADSVLAASTQPSVSEASALIGLAALTGKVGRTSQLSALTNAFITSDISIPAPVKSTAAEFFAIAALGVCGDPPQQLEQRLLAQIDSYVAPDQQARLKEALTSRPLSMLGSCSNGRSALRVPPNGDQQLEMQVALARGDQAKLKQLLRNADEESRGERPGDLSLDYTYQVAWVRAASGDTVGAIRQLDRVLNALPSVNRLSLREAASAAAVVRAMALRAQLAFSEGDKPNASRWAHAVIDLWSTADPSLAKTTEQMRQIVRGTLQ